MVVFHLDMLVYRRVFVDIPYFVVEIKFISPIEKILRISFAAVLPLTNDWLIARMVREKRGFLNPRPLARGELWYVMISSCGFYDF